MRYYGISCQRFASTKSDRCLIFSVATTVPTCIACAARITSSSSALGCSGLASALACPEGLLHARSSEVDEMYKTSNSQNKTPPEAGLFASLTDCTKGQARRSFTFLKFKKDALERARVKINIAVFWGIPLINSLLVRF